MLRFFFLITFSILLFTFASYGQMCGTGTFKIEISSNQETSYKLYSLTPKGKTQFSTDFRKMLNKTFKIAKNDKKLEKVSLIHTPFEVKKNIAQKFLSKYKPENFEETFLNYSGIAQNGTIQFSTTENNIRLFLLEVSSKNGKAKYFIHNYLGGCDKVQKIDLK